MEGTTVDLDDTRDIAKRALRDFTSEAGSETAKWSRQNLTSEMFPVPDLVLFALTQILDIPRTPPEDKTKWRVDASFRGVPFSVALRKFGFQLTVPSDASDEHVSSLVGGLHRAAKFASKPLKQFATEQIDDGNVTLNNQFYSFDRTYRFFRESAAERYAHAQRPSTKPDRPAAALAARLASKDAAEGSYLAGAMLEAYFSRLEHLLVLVLPFTDFDPSSGNLRDFVGHTWDKKFKLVFDVSNEGPAATVYASLRKLMDELRNPRAHGGFQKQGASFFFHSPGVTMALPVTLHDYDVVADIEAAFIDPWAFDTLCEKLDAVDEFLRDSAISRGVQFVEAGLDPVFSAEEREIYRAAAIAEDDDFDSFIQGEVWRHDNAMNFDD